MAKPDSDRKNGHKHSKFMGLPCSTDILRYPPGGLRRGTLYPSELQGHRQQL